MYRYLNSCLKRINNKSSNLRSHIRFIKYRFFCKNAHLSDEIIFAKNTKLHIGNGSVFIGDNLRIKENSYITVVSGSIEIGDCVFVNRNCNIACREKIIIGDSVLIGPYVTIWNHDHKFDETGVYEMKYNTGEIIIEKGCWIGAGAIILRNTRIGEGSVIGAGTVVKGDIPAHSVVTSNRELIIRPIVSN